MNKLQTIVVVVVIFMIGFTFYWYEYRTTKIKEQCSADARFDQKAISEPNNAKRQEFINLYYNDCLMRFGLK